MNKKIYIIGKIPNKIDRFCINKFYRVQIQLIQMGYETINPIKNLLNSKLTPNEAKSKNFHELINAQGAYIMPCINKEIAKKNIEVAIAFDLDLIIINSFLYIDDDKKPLKK
jgi:hypothetical protein